MELNKLQVLKRKTSTDDHGVTVTRASVRTRATEVSPTVTTGSKNGLVAPETVEGSVLHVESDDTDTLSILHEQIERKVLDEKVGVVTERLAVQGVKDGVTCAVCGSGATVGLATLAVLERLATESALVDFALLGTRKGDTKVLKLRGSAPFMP